MSIFTYIKNFTDVNKLSFGVFLSIGLSTAILYFLLFTVLWKTLAINYNVAVSIAYLASTLFYFFMNRHFTFKRHTNSMRKQIIKFTGMVLFNYLITLLVVHSFVEIFSIPPYIAMVIAIGATTILSYTISKFWVFQVKNQGEI